MNLSVTEMYPKVFKSNCRQTLYIRLNDLNIQSNLLQIKIQPMEKYAILHTKLYRVDEEHRYPYVALTGLGDGLYSVEYDFTVEQKYSVKVKYGDDIICSSYLYSLDEDLAALKAYKGDTHLHTCCSDGEQTPFEAACAYRNAGFDFIAVTDHHKYAPSLEAKAQMAALTEQFFVVPGEEVHNRAMGYIHIVNFDGDSSVNELIETDEDYVNSEIEKILVSRDLSALSDPYCVAYRIFVANEIRKRGGIAIMAHPYWEAYGEYNMQTEEFIYHWQNGDFDAMEVLAGCDAVAIGDGNNLQEMIRTDLLAEGFKIPLVGASDAHRRVYKYPYDSFNIQFTLVFAKDFSDIKSAISEERAVAIDRRSDETFRAIGKFRYAKYARFLMREYFPAYTALTAAHAKALSAADGHKTAEILQAERAIDDFKNKFFAV